jgi:hypothetical protein
VRAGPAVLKRARADADAVVLDERGFLAYSHPAPITVSTPGAC